MIKLTTQKETIKNIISILKHISTNSTDIEKVIVNSTMQNGRLVTNIEIVSKQIIPN